MEDTARDPTEAEEGGWGGEGEGGEGGGQRRCGGEWGGVGGGGGGGEGGGVRVVHICGILGTSSFVLLPVIKQIVKCSDLS